MAPLNSSSKPYNDPSLSSHIEDSSNDGEMEHWSNSPEHFRHNSKTSMSSPQPPNLIFPDLFPPPTDIPLRLPPQDPALEELDKVYERSHHPFLGSQGLGCGGYNQKTDESCNNDALKALEQHIKARTPYIQLASSRLQAACSVRNESPFDLPKDPMRNLSPNMQGFPPQGGSTNFPMPGDKGGVKAISCGRGNGRKDSGIGFIPKSPIGMHGVDAETGKGLREFLLQKGKEYGMRKRECKSISLHDFTPDMRSGRHQNVLLGHYESGNGQRVDAYEVDLPTTQVNPETGEECIAIETWLWILISRPTLSYDPTDTKTHVPPTASGLIYPLSDIFYTPYSKASNLSEPPAVHATPPNFPHPIPLSWVAFAAPKAHITTYPEGIENYDEPASRYPFVTKPMTINKRIDYDFSFSGIPLFEFSSADLFTHESKRIEFLSIDRMGGWHENDPFQMYTNEEYKRMYSLWEDGETGVGGFDEGGKPKAPMPAPNRGLWWRVFYDRLNEDVERWKKVRNAMGRGKCHIVLRWVEAIDEHEAGTGQNGGVVGGKLGLGGARRGVQGKRQTRSETRRRSGLALGDHPVGLAIGGIAGLGVLGESTRLRASGNRELGRGPGVVWDKDSGKIRKR